MFSVLSTLSFIRIYLKHLNDQISLVNPSYRLSKAQAIWLGFVLSAILVTNSLCWAVHSRSSHGKHKESKLRWIFKQAKLPWNKLLIFSIRVILKKYGITEGVLVLDDSHIGRSKNTKKLHGLQKLKDKATGGYLNGQSLMLLLLVTDKVTIPVGFEFYQPDPAWLEWKKEDRRLRKLNIPKSKRPEEPQKGSTYPSKLVIAVNLVKSFKLNFNNINIRAVLADCFFGNKNFSNGIKKIDKKLQIISQIRANQLVKMHGKKISMETLFKRYPGVRQTVNIRGVEKIVTMYGMRVNVVSYGCKLVVIALKYAGEDDYRYITATNLSWRTIDIVNAYSLRWLIEVFFQDWKTHEGWQSMATHQGEIGARSGVVLSLMSDHALLLHPQQSNRIDAGLPAVTVGSLCHQAKIEAFLNTVEEIINSDQPKSAYEKMAEQLLKLYDLRPSKKHLVGFDMSQFDEVSYLNKRYA